MKKLLLVFCVSLAITSCANKDLEILKSDLKTSDKLSDAEIATTKFKTTQMISSDGKNALMNLSLDRKSKLASEGGVYAINSDVCNENEIKENTDVSMIEAYRIAEDTVFKKIYFVNENKIVGKFLLK